MDAPTRHSFLTDILELDSFLTQRHVELSSQDSNFTHTFMQAPMILRHQSISQIESYQSVVMELLNAIRDTRLQQLIMIQTSNK